MTRLLVVGCGSIGTRHIRNLVGLGVDVVACDVDSQKLHPIKTNLHLPVHSDLKKALEEELDGVVIASPSNLHFTQAIEAIQRGLPVFIEKPMTTSVEDARVIDELAAEKNVTVLNGLNMRFHPSINMTKDMLEQNLIGQVYSMRAIAGYYLPDWHPGTDYRKSYSANRRLGGGVLEDGIHELDYIRYFFGEIDHVYCIGGKVSNLDIDTEDMAELLMKCSNGVHAELHLNYLNRTRLREFVIIGENGIIKWDSNAGTVHRFDANEDCWKVYRGRFEFNINDTYILEMTHFLRCIDGEEKSINDAREGRATVDIIECAKESMRTGQPIMVKAQTASA